MNNLELLVTLWPSFPHFERFANDIRLQGIRLNSAMMHMYELEEELDIAVPYLSEVPLYFDIKGRQLRVEESFPTRHHLELRLNHTIEVKTPTMVLFKGGEDYALLEKVVDGNHLIFDGGPRYNVYAGESLHIREPSLSVSGRLFTDYEINKIEKARDKGFTNWCLSYVQSQRDIDEFREYIGRDAYVIAKIEDKRGLAYVADDYKKQPNLTLMAACGDLYVEVDKPHNIIEALTLIIEKEPQALAGSRMLLSIINKPIPSCADLLQLAWLAGIGYKKMMLCDELCLKEELLAAAINVFESFRVQSHKQIF